MIPQPAADARSWNARVWRLAGPIILSNVTVPLVGAVDTALMGRQGDPALIGGVAVGAQIFSLAYWMFGFLRTGTTGFAAQAAGAGDGVEVRATLIRPLLLGLVIAAALLALQTPLLAACLWIVGPSAEVTDAARLYFAVRIWDAPATFFSYGALGWLMAMKRADAVFYVTLLVNLANVAVSSFFVFSLDWGIAGVAWGTVIAQYLGLLLTLIYLRQELIKHGAIASGAAFKDLSRWRRLFIVNRDIFLRTLALELVFTLFLRLSAEQGDVVLAANAILLHLQAIMAYALDGFAHAAEVLVGWALGARRRRDLAAAVKAAAIWAMLFAIPVALLYLFAGPTLFKIFTDQTPVLAAAESMLIWVALSPLISVWSFLYDGVFFGATQSREMRNSMLLALSVFAASAWIAAPVWGNDGLWLAFLLFLAVRALTLHLYYPRILKRLPQDS